MFTITADRARHYSEQPWIENVVEIDLRDCLRAVYKASGNGMREVEVDAPNPDGSWTTVRKGNDERIERVVDELRDRGFCAVHKRVSSGGGSSYRYHIEW